MNRTSLFVMLMTVLMLTPAVSVMAEDQKPAVQYVQNLELAKVILHPAPHALLAVTNDPFKPLIAVPADEGGPGFNPTGGAISDEDLDNVSLVGVIKLDQTYCAYIHVGEKNRVVRIGDVVGKYTITAIDMNQVVFKSDDRVIVKKRGKL